ncbi:TGB-3 [Cherry twisted leaf associated virus]|uniref:Movement protein TGBp3 n=1 Tax=Cherry twisted leaf associated virus TaxID=1424279 RepID=A0A068ER11_9VIRU|nr:TGB-3 [Cherry twisted leaf associated virus]AID51404.1 TGB-3 [Cherry twisted leaf associated virus]
MFSLNVMVGLIAFSITACIIMLFNSNKGSVCTVVITGERAVVTGCEITPELSNLLTNLKPHSHSLGF